MTHLRLKLSIAGILLAGAVGYLAFAGVQKGWVYTLGVDQYVEQPAQHPQRVRLCGKVGEDSLEMNKAQLWAKFQIRGEKAFVPVAYKGVIPDMFKPGAEVIIEGKRDPQGVFQADMLMTKCASKYEEMPKSHPQTGDAGKTGGV
jgi:cytochrome c-type biogenesis protein CcmE